MEDGRRDWSPWERGYCSPSYSCCKPYPGDPLGSCRCCTLRRCVETFHVILYACRCCAKKPGWGISRAEQHGRLSVHPERTISLSLLRVNGTLIRYSSMRFSSLPSCYVLERVRF